MVFHIGIVTQIGQCSIYNERNKNIETFFVCEIGPNDSEKVDVMFKEIKVKINGNEIGCTYICLNWDYKNEIRKILIKNGKQNGFLKIQIAEGFSLLCLTYCFQTKCKPNLGDIIWIVVDNEYCGIWEKTNTKPKILDVFPFDLTLIENNLLEVKKKMNRGDPNIIIIDEGGKNNLNLDLLKKLFRNCKFLLYEDKMPASEVALLKARIMAKDMDVMEYDTFIQFAIDGVVKINDKEVIIFNWLELLPLEKIVVVPILNDVKILKIVAWFQEKNEQTEYFLEEINVTFEMLTAGEILFSFKIDENLVCSTYFEIKESKLIKDLKQFYFMKFQKTYNIPQKILINISNIYALGIDLGTSRCCAAVSRKNGIQIVSLGNTAEERLLPSYVSFNEENEKCGQIVIEQLSNFAKSTVFDSKRIIGRNFEDVKIDEKWSFEVKNIKNKPILKIKRKNKILEKHPEEVSAALLKHIKQKVEEFQGKELEEVVITVPAAFVGEQKFATHVSAWLAGWKTIHLLPEPIAASIAYFIERPIPSDFTMLLFDFGGGTLDVCVFKISNNNTLQIASQAGDNNLGGRDFDNLLFNHFSFILNKEFNINVKENEKLKYRLMQKCTSLKHALSIEKEAILDVNDFDTKNLNDIMKITRQEFEEMAKKFLIQISDVIINGLSMASFTSPDIHKVLFAGGSSRMPMIKNLLQTMFTKAEHCCEQNPEEVVAIGAAYYAYYMQAEILKKKAEQERDNRSKAKNEMVVEKRLKQDCSVM